MTNVIHTGSYPPLPFNMREIIRYAGFGCDSAEARELISDCIDESQGKFVYKVCSLELPIRMSGGNIDFGFSSVSSEDLTKNLRGCRGAVLFAATVGVEIDRLIGRYSAVLPSRALIFQAIGAERIESLCNVFCADLSATLSERGERTRPRFSPGYGDLPLSFQKDILNVLDCRKKIGITLSGSLTMLPSKSVTALVGIEKIPDGER